MNIEPHQITTGNTRTPILTVLEQSGKPVDLTGLTPKFLMKDRAGTAVVDNATSGVTAHPTQAFTVDTSANRIKANDHRVREGDQIVVSNSGGALPAGLAASTRYFARDVTKNTFKVCEVETEDPVDITDAGSGTHSFYIVGSVQYDFQTADVDTPGEYGAWFNVFDGAEFDTFPPNGKELTVVIMDAK